MCAGKSCPILSHTIHQAGTARMSSTCGSEKVRAHASGGAPADLGKEDISLKHAFVKSPVFALSCGEVLDMVQRWSEPGPSAGVKTSWLHQGNQSPHPRETLQKLRLTNPQAGSDHVQEVWAGSSVASRSSIASLVGLCVYLICMSVRLFICPVAFHACGPFLVLTVP